MRNHTMSMAVPMALLLAAVLAAAASAQQPPSCATKLIPCAQFLNATSPPESCCGPLKDALTNDLSCLCKIFDNPEILKTFHIDLNSALRLPGRCGMTSFTANACNSTAGAPTSTPPPPTPPSPPATPGASDRVAWMGMPKLMGMLLVWWSILA